MNQIILFLGAGLFVTIGDLILAQWARTSNWILLVTGLILNLVGIGFYAQTLKLESVGLATAIFLGINVVAVALGGYFFLRQSITIKEFAGLGLMMLAIMVIEGGI
jgi:multidrug transporter EmrE-like cation transporter